VTFTTRFAPSPTGPLHLGHAYSALIAQDMARAAKGTFLLRMEDTDIARVRPEWEALIYQDLAWLGLQWDTPVLRQSDNLARYDVALEQLNTLGILYPCRCKRSDIRAALSAPQEGGPAISVYPGTCRHRSMSERGPADAVRMDLAKALTVLGTRHPTFQDTGPKHAGRHQIQPKWMRDHIGDAVIGRKDIGTVSYVLSAVVDDADQGISHVIRGSDLFETTFLQVLLQALLGLPTPIYHHHRLIRDEHGKRLAKRDDARAIRAYRQDGLSPKDVRALVGL